jgi:hypothetical protein
MEQFEKEYQKNLRAQRQQTAKSLRDSLSHALRFIKSVKGIEMQVVFPYNITVVVAKEESSNTEDHIVLHFLHVLRKEKEDGIYNDINVTVSTRPLSECIGKIHNK